MTRWHGALAGRFHAFPAFQQILMAANELNRARRLLEHDREYRQALERVLELLDLTCQDQRWRCALRELRRAREVTAQYYAALRPQDTAVLQKCLVQLSSQAWKMLKGGKER